MTAPLPAPLQDILQMRVAWKGNFQGKTFPTFTEYSIDPEPGWPVGRKGLMLACAWEQLSKPTSDGIIISDGDVILDPHDVGAMNWAAAHERDAVHTAPVKLWPRATSLPDWIWGHRKELPEGTSGQDAMAAWQKDIDDPVTFTFNYTFLPRRLILAAIKSGLKEWIYPNVDMHMYETARDCGIPVRVVRNGCHPRHIHY